MATFTLIIADEPFDPRDSDPGPFVESVVHGADAHVSTPASNAFHRCLDAIAGCPPIVQADRGYDEYDLREDLDAIAEGMEDGVGVLEEIAVGQHADRFVPEDRPGRLRFAAREAADHLALALKTFRDIADWPDPEERPA